MPEMCGGLCVDGNARYHVVNVMATVRGNGAWNSVMIGGRFEFSVSHHQ